MSGYIHGKCGRNRMKISEVEAYIGAFACIFVSRLTHKGYV
jgi:hypothetical protein